MTFQIPLTSQEQAATEAMTAVALARKNAVTNAPAYKAKGAALASLCIAEARTQGSAWTRFYRSMLELEAEGRAAFRSEIAKLQKEMGVAVKANEDNPAYAGARRSALVRLSQMNTISKALDAGAEMDASWPFDYAVAHAREMLNSQGKGDKRGRKPTPWAEKVKAFLEKNVPEGEWSQAVELIETLAKTKE